MMVMFPLRMRKERSSMPAGRRRPDLEYVRRSSLTGVHSFEYPTRLWYIVSLLSFFGYCDVGSHRQ